MSKTIATITVEFTKAQMAPKPRVTKANQVMKPKKGRGSYRRERSSSRDWEGGSKESPFLLTKFSK